MEICSGPTLKEYLDKRYQTNSEIDRKTNFKFFKQIIEGIKHVHRQGIIHRDLKPANVFITGEGVIKIGDFGLARAIDKNDTKKISNLANVISSHIATSKFWYDSLSIVNIKSNQNRKKWSMRGKERSLLSQKVGTPLYLSPEQVEGVFYDEKVDIFSIGLILLELCYKFATNHEKIIGFANLREGKIPKEVTTSMVYETAILKELTKINPKQRPSARNIQKFPDYKAWKKEMCSEDDDYS